MKWSNLIMAVALSKSVLIVIPKFKHISSIKIPTWRGKITILLPQITLHMKEKWIHISHMKSWLQIETQCLEEWTSNNGIFWTVVNSSVHARKVSYMVHTLDYEKCYLGRKYFGSGPNLLIIKLAIMYMLKLKILL